MNDAIRAAVQEALSKRGMNQSRLAERIGVTPQALSRTLNERGKVPGLWRSILEELDLELVVRERSGEAK